MNRQHKNEKPFPFHTPLPEQTFMHASIVLHLANTENPVQIVFATHQRSESFGVRGVSHRFEFFGVRQFIAALKYFGMRHDPCRFDILRIPSRPRTAVRPHHLTKPHVSPLSETQRWSCFISKNMFLHTNRAGQTRMLLKYSCSPKNRERNHR